MTSRMSRFASAGRLLDMPRPVARRQSAFTYGVPLSVGLWFAIGWAWWVLLS